MLPSSKSSSSVCRGNGKQFVTSRHFLSTSPRRTPCTNSLPPAPSSWQCLIIFNTTCCRQQFLTCHWIIQMIVVYEITNKNLFKIFYIKFYFIMNSVLLQIAFHFEFYFVLYFGPLYFIFKFYFILLFYFKYYYILNFVLFWLLTPFYIEFHYNSIFLNLTLFWIYFCSKHFLFGMTYLLTYFMFKFATSTFSCSTFFGDDSMLTRECFFGVRFNNSEIGTSKCFSGACRKNWTVV